MPQLGDPNFQRSVILMIEHSANGAMGLVINRTAPLTLEDVAQGHDFQLARPHAVQNVFVGGPVEPQRGFVLHDNEAVPEKHEVVPGLFLSMTLDALQPLLENPSARLRFCLGYSGWGPQQLEGEIKQGSWLFTEASKKPVLDSDPDKLWEATLRSMGVDPAMLVTSGGIN